jgi:glycosyltransferase involved in cell wall biosynthesis
MTEQTRLWVTIDARALDGALMGTQVHVLELVKALARIGELRLRVLIYGERIDDETLALLRGLSGVEVLAVEEIDEHTHRSTVFHRPQQAFSPSDVALAWRLGERIVLNQLDLIAYRNPIYFQDAAAWEEYRRASRHGMAAAERVVVFSGHTRDELLGEALVEVERVRVIPPGLDHRFAGGARRPAGLERAGRPTGLEGAGPPASLEEAVQREAVQRQGLEDAGFLLCLGADYEHKNRVFALRLLGALRERHGWRGRLVLAGAHMPCGSSRAEEQEELAADPGLREAVVELGPVEEAEKEWLMAEAGAVLYPSRYEGFGLVPYEAALHGVPCVFAAVSSLAEGAAAKAATIVPWDPAESADAAYALLSDPVERDRHVGLLVEAAAELTWERAARATVEAYREAVAAPARVAATLSRDAVARERELLAAHDANVQALIDEREIVLDDYEELLAEVGPARGLIGEHGSLPVDLQRALLAFSAHPKLSRPLYGLAAGAYRLSRSVARLLSRAQS